MHHNIPNAEKAIEQALNVHPIIPYRCNHDDVSVTPRKRSRSLKSGVKKPTTMKS